MIIHMQQKYRNINFYHVLEISNNRAPNSNETILPDPDAPDLPPPLEPDSQDTDTSPVYKDINELSCKPNNMANCEQCCYQEASGLNDNIETAKAHQQKVKFVLCCVYACQV